MTCKPGKTHTRVPECPRDLQGGEKRPRECGRLTLGRNVQEHRPNKQRPGAPAEQRMRTHTVWVWWQKEGTDPGLFAQKKPEKKARRKAQEDARRCLKDQ